MTELFKVPPQDDPPEPEVTTVAEKIGIALGIVLVAAAVAIALAGVVAVWKAVL